VDAVQAMLLLLLLEKIWLEIKLISRASRGLEGYGFTDIEIN
jgi:hypothetical protein